MTAADAVNRAAPPLVLRARKRGQRGTVVPLGQPARRPNRLAVGRGAAALRAEEVEAAERRRGRLPQRPGAAARLGAFGVVKSTARVRPGGEDPAHVLRRSAPPTAQTRADVRVVQELLGHASIRYDQRYRVSPEHLRPRLRAYYVQTRGEGPHVTPCRTRPPRPRPPTSISPASSSATSRPICRPS